MYLDSGDSGALRTLAQPRDTSIPTLRTSEPKGPPPEDPEEPTPRPYARTVNNPNASSPH